MLLAYHPRGEPVKVNLHDRFARLWLDRDGCVGVFREQPLVLEGIE
jgi:hypothetical protein